MTRDLIHFLAAAALVCGTSLTAAAQVPLADEAQTLPAPPDLATPNGATAEPTEVVAEGEAEDMVVKLSADGELLGLVSAHDEKGVEIPVFATVAFVKDGEVIQTASTDQSGSYKLAGLNPGDYSVTASSNSYGAASFDVELVSYETASVVSQPVLETCIGCGTPVEAYPVEEVVVGEPLVGAPCNTCGQAADACGCGAAGGGGGGGFGIGGLLGTAGLVTGIVALADDGDKNRRRPIASPFTPY